MDRLFLELYLDENVPVLVAKILRARGLSVAITDEVGRKGSSDADQLEFAAENGYAIVTMNRVDFEALTREYFHSDTHHSGIFIVSDNSPQVIAQRRCEFVDRFTADELKDQIIYI